LCDGRVSRTPKEVLKTVVVRDREKARLFASGGDQEDVPEAPAPSFSGGREASFAKSRWHRKRGVWLFSYGLGRASRLLAKAVPA
jgi:hypothetical protein